MQSLAIGTHKTLGQSARRAVDGLIELPVRVGKVVHRHVTGAVEHSPFLRITELGKGTVGVRGVVATGTIRHWHFTHRHLLVARLAPVHQLGIGGRRGLTRGVVEVMHAFNQHFDKLAIIRGSRVEIPDLLQVDLHGLVAAAHHHFFSADLLGDLGWHPGNDRHLDHAVRHLDGVDHHLDFFLGGHIHRHQHGLDRGHIGVGIERDIATGQQIDGAHGLQQALANDGDVAAVEVGAGHCAFHLCARPGHVDPRMHINPALGHDRAAHGNCRAGVQQCPPGKAGDIDGAVDGHGRGDHVHHFGGFGDGRIQLGGHCPAGQYQRVARFQVQRGLGARGIHITTRQHADTVTQHPEGVAHIGVTQQIHIARERLDPDIADLGATEVAIGQQTLTQHTGDGDAIDRLDVNRAARGGVKRATRDIVVAAIKHQFLHPNADLGSVDTGAQRHGVLRRHQAANVDHRSGTQQHVRAHVHRADRTAQQDVAVGDDAELAVGEQVAVAHRHIGHTGQGVCSCC